MVHTGLFATSAECIAKMGKNYNSTDVDEAMINAFCLQAESLINVSTRRNWSDDFTAPATTTLNADVWYILSEIESNLVGIYGITYDMSRFTTRGEAESMITILRDGILRGLQFLRNKNMETFIDGET